MADMNYGKKMYPRTQCVDGPGESLTEENTSVQIPEDHSRTYIGDFPPKDDYKKEIY